MNLSNPVLVDALRQTAARLRSGAPYQWGHFGSGNCGHLAQTLTRRSRAEIQRAAVERARDWGDAALEHCPASGYPLDHILSEMLQIGLSLSDIRHLEELSDRRILARLSARQLSRNNRDDVVRYLEAWADGLEGE